MADDIRFEITGDGTDAEGALRDVGGAADVAKGKLGEVGDAADSLREVGASAGEARGEIDDIGASGERAGERAASGFNQLRGAIAALGLAAIARDFVRINEAAEGARLAIASLSGSGREAADALQYVNNLADTLGTSAVELTEQFVSLSAATKGTALEGAATRDIFEAVVASMAKLGRSSAQTSQALVAIQQIASKGTVSMEELRGQLGEALPGALQALAKEMGVSTTELTEMVSSGNLLAEDVLPKLAAGLREAFDVDTTKRVETLAASLARLENAYTNAVTSVGQSGLASAIKSGVDVAADGIDQLAARTKQIGSDFGAFASYVAGDIETLGDLAKIVDLNAEAARNYIDGAQGAAEGSKALEDASASAAAEQKRLAGEMAGVAASAQAEEESLDSLNNALGTFGLDFDQLTTGVSKAQRDIIQAFDTIVSDPRVSGEQIQTVFDAALGKLSKESAPALKQSLQRAFEEGQIGTKELKADLDAVDKKLEELAKKADATGKRIKDGLDLGADKTGKADKTKEQQDVRPADTRSDAEKRRASVRQIEEERAALTADKFAGKIGQGDFEAEIAKLDARKSGKQITDRELAQIKDLADRQAGDVNLGGLREQQALQQQVAGKVTEQAQVPIQLDGAKARADLEREYQSNPLRIPVQFTAAGSELGDAAKMVGD